MSEAERKEPWHLDKRVPLALIGTIVFQTLLIVMAGTALAVRFDARLEAVETYQSDNKSTALDLAVLKSQITDIRDSLKRIEREITDESRP